MKKLLSIALLAGLMTACSTPKPLYSWYNYEDVTYKFDKKQSEAAHTTPRTMRNFINLQ